MVVRSRARPESRATDRGASIPAMRRGLAVGLFFICVFPATAVARRLAGGPEKAAIIATIRAAHDIGPEQTGSCMRVWVSTVNRNWATMEFLYVARCASQDANGVSVIRRTHGHWHFVTAGSSFSCPIPGHIPARVKRDLRLTCSNGLS